MYFILGEHDLWAWFQIDFNYLPPDMREYSHTPPYCLRWG